MNEKIRYTFSKEEHLKSAKTIELLFVKGQQVFSYPFKIIYLTEEKQEAAFPEVLCSASKRHFKHAVDRNHLKRLMREAYRLQKPEVFDIDTKVTAMALIYIGKKVEPYQTVKKGMKKALDKLLHALEEL